MEVLININLDEIQIRFNHRDICDEFQSILPDSKTDIIMKEDFIFVVYKYNRNDDLRLFFTLLDNFMEKHPDITVKTTGPNIDHVKKHITEFKSNERLASTSIDLIDVLLNQLGHLVKSKQSLFYTKEPIGPGLFADKTLTDQKSPLKNYIDYTPPHSYYILDVRSICKLYKITDDTRSLIISTKNGELPFHTSTLFLLTQVPNPSDLSLNDIISKGNNYNVDIRIRDIYGEQCNILPVDIIASSMGKIQHDSDLKDVLKSFIFVLVINISNIVGMLVN